MEVEIEEVSVRVKGGSKHLYAHPSIRIDEAGPPQLHTMLDLTLLTPLPLPSPSSVQYPGHNADNQYPPLHPYQLNHFIDQSLRPVVGLPCIDIDIDIDIDTNARSIPHAFLRVADGIQRRAAPTQPNRTGRPISNDPLRRPLLHFASM